MNWTLELDKGYAVGHDRLMLDTSHRKVSILAMLSPKPPAWLGSGGTHDLWVLPDDVDRGSLGEWLSESESRLDDVARAVEECDWLGLDVLLADLSEDLTDAYRDGQILRFYDPEVWLTGDLWDSLTLVFERGWNGAVDTIVADAVEEGVSLDPSAVLKALDREMAKAVDVDEWSDPWSMNITSEILPIQESGWTIRGGDLAHPESLPVWLQSDALLRVLADRLAFSVGCPKGHSIEEIGLRAACWETLAQVRQEGKMLLTIKDRMVVWGRINLAELDSEELLRFFAVSKATGIEVLGVEGPIPLDEAVRLAQAVDVLAEATLTALGAP